MALSTLAEQFSNSSGEIETIDFQRSEEILKRHSLLVDYFQSRGLDALLLRDPANFSWFTCGGDSTQRGGPQPVASLLLTHEARVVLCDNVVSGQIFDRELAGMGFLLKERPWTEGAEVLIADVTRGRKIGCDVSLPGTEDVSEDLLDFRLERSPREISLLRDLGSEVAHAIEATARAFVPGTTESEVAGHLAHRLMRHQIEPVMIRVQADGQGCRYRHWSYGTDQIERHCVISALGRRHGLHAGACRTVCLGAPSPELIEDYQLAAFVLATGMRASLAGLTADEAWSRVARIYEKFQKPDEWRQADQGDLIGWTASERPMRPGTTWTIPDGAALYWHPSVNWVSVGETVLSRPNGFELLTRTSNWPMLGIRAGSDLLEVPGMLIRELSPSR